MVESNLTPTLSIEGTDFRVLSYQLSRRFDFVDTLICKVDASIDVTFEDIHEYLRRESEFVLENDVTHKKQFFRGQVCAVRNDSDTDGVRSVTFEIMSALFPLMHRRNHRIFQEVSIKEIIQKVLDDAGVTEPVTFSAPQLNAPLVYCVQYNETDYDFVRRLLSREGATWTVRFEANSSKIVFIDDTSKIHESAPIPLVFRADFGPQASDNSVGHLEQQHEVRPDALRVSAYDPHRPGLTIEEHLEGSDDGCHSNEIYCPLTTQPDPERAKTIAQTILQSHQCRRNLISGETGTQFLEPGTRISISGHPYRPLNGEYTILSVEFYADTPRSFARGSSMISARQNIRFEAAPLDTPWRPEHLPPTSKISGLQSAITTGLSEEDIHTNEHGEVKVHFHWDRLGGLDEKASRFIRSAQLPTAGAMLLPRVGWEVTVAYLEGDADEPVVISRLYNGTAMPPYTLPDNALRSSLQTGTSPGDGSSNEIRMSDTKGDEQMMFNASRDMSTEVGNNCTLSIGHDLKVEVGANQDLTVIDSVEVSVGGNQTTTISGNQTESITSKAVDDVTGDHSSNISGNVTQMIGGDHTRTFEANSQLEVAGNSMSVVVGSVSLNTSQGFDHKVGAALLNVAGGSRSVVVGATKTETTSGVKMIVAKGTRAVEAGVLNSTIGGAMIVSAKGSRSDSADTTWTETVGAKTQIEAKNITIEGLTSVNLTMGNAKIKMTPASVEISGDDIQIKGNLVQTAPMNINN